MSGRDITIIFNTAYECSRLIIAVNIKDITKYKRSVIYEKLKKRYSIFMCLLIMLFEIHGPQ